MARILATPPKDAEGKGLAENMGRELAELQLFQAPGTLVILSWQDLAANLALDTRTGSKGESLPGEIIDAATVGLSSLQLPVGKLASLSLKAQVRSAPPAKPLPVSVITLEYDGHAYHATSKRVNLPAGQTEIAL